MVSLRVTLHESLFIGNWFKKTWGREGGVQCPVTMKLILHFRSSILPLNTAAISDSPFSVEYGSDVDETHRSNVLGNDFQKES